MDNILLDFDPYNKTLISQKGVSVFHGEPEGLQDLVGTGPSIFSFPSFTYFNSIYKLLLSRGYQIGQTLFGKPYDWRFGLSQPSDFFQHFQSVVEKAFLKNNQKVILIAHSLGGYLTNILLTEKTSKEWREKFIEKVILVATSWSGSGTSFVMMMLGRFPYAPFFKTDLLKKMIIGLGVAHIHTPNTKFYENITYFKLKNGTEIKGNQIISFLKKRFDQATWKIAKQNLKYVEKIPNEIKDVDLKIIFNSGMKTIFGLKEGKFYGYKNIYTQGDLVGSKGIEWSCSHWENVECFDFKKKSMKYEHLRLLKNPRSLDLIMKWIFGENEPNTESPDL